MNKIFYLIFFAWSMICTIGNCQAQLIDTVSYPLKSIRKYCQNNPDTVIEEINYLYDDKRRLKKQYNKNMRMSRDTAFISCVLYNYNDKNLLVSKEFYSDTSKLDRIKVYKYDKNGRLIYEAYDLGVRGKYMESAYTYDINGKLINSTLKVNYNNYVYNYSYDSLDNKVKTYENGNHKYSYVYENKKLIKEVIHLLTNDSIRNSNQVITNYTYNSKGQLIQTKKDNKILELLEYDNDRLATKWSYNEFELLPCRNQCCNNYIFKYEYYE